jgi:hypothetical protein
MAALAILLPVEMSMLAASSVAKEQATSTSLDDQFYRC